MGLMDRVLSAHDRLAACTTEAARWDEAARLMDDIGVYWISAGTATRDRPEAIAIVSTTPAMLMSDYIAAGIYRTDPWMRHCAESRVVDEVDLGNLAGSRGLLDAGLHLRSLSLRKLPIRHSVQALPIDVVA